MAVLIVSYSRVDQPQIRAIVSLLQTAMRDLERTVFWDGELEPGDDWFKEIRRNIDQAPQLFVFWCDHSSVSDEVRKEFLYALTQGKRVVPVLLDDTPLAPELRRIHGIDLRKVVRHGRRGPSGPRKKTAVLAAAVAFVSVITAASLNVRWSAPDSEQALAALPMSGAYAQEALPATLRVELDNLVTEKAKGVFGTGAGEFLISSGISSTDLRLTFLAHDYLQTEHGIDARVQYSFRGPPSGASLLLLEATADSDSSVSASTRPIPPAAIPAALATLVAGVLVLALWEFRGWLRRKAIVREFSDFLSQSDHVHVAG